MADKYHPIEFGDYEIGVKMGAMREWWVAAFRLLKEYDFTSGLMEKIIKEQPVQFREGAHEMLNMLHKKGVPVVIMSAGIGNMIEAYMNQENILHDNVHIVANYMIFGKDGRFTEAREPVIHSMNKHEIEASEMPFFNEIKERPNAILLGDLPEDTGMAGSWCRSVIKAGFLNHDIEANMSRFIQAFDVLILNDAGMGYVNSMLREII